MIVLGKALESPLDCKENNQSILKEMSPEYSLDGLMLKPKLQYFGHLMWRAISLEKTLMLGRIEGKRRRGWQRKRWLASLTQWTQKDREACPWDCRVGHDWVTQQQCHHKWKWLARLESSGRSYSSDSSYQLLHLLWILFNGSLPQMMLHKSYFDDKRQKA